MIATAAAPASTMRPYRKQGQIDYARLDYNPDEPVLKPEAMQQNPALHEILGLLASRFTAFQRRPDVFLEANTILCYDPDDLNVRVSPDVYLAFGVNADAIRERKLYLPWEAGKPPDWVLEVASVSTAREDVGRKRAIYAHIGVPEYWRFDPKDGKYHGAKLAGDRLVDGAYEPIELTTAPDGILKGHSKVLGLSLCWDANWPRLYDPATKTYLETWQQERVARRTAETQAAVEQAERLAERAARRVAESRAASEQAAREAAETQVAVEQAERLAERAARLAEQAAREAAEARIRQLEATLRRRQADQ